MPCRHAERWLVPWTTDSLTVAVRLRLTCAAGTIRWPPRLRPKPPGEGERMRCSLLQSRSEAAARVLPGDELNSSAVDLLETPINLLPPCFFRARVDGLVQAANQRIDQSGANLGRKGERVS